MFLENHPYRHFKGGLYIARCIAKDSETLEEKVVYQSCSTKEIWVRPATMFFGTVEKNGERVNRFEPVTFGTEEGA